jgi:hypothetical protein
MATLPKFLKPDTKPQPRPDPENPADHDALIYVRSILWTRVAVGLAGILLPVALFVIDRLWFKGDPTPRDSMSAYYWSGMRDVFVTIIFGTGAFLILYRIAERSLDNTASIVAGAGATLLALFPTKAGDNLTPTPITTPLQDHLGGPSVVFYFHILGTAAFVTGLATVSFLYGLREGRWRPVPGKKLTPRFWRVFHWICTGGMVVGFLWILVSSFPHHNFGPRVDVLIGEVMCTWSFGPSWLAKGFERDTLFGTPIAERRRRSTRRRTTPDHPCSDDS